MLADFVSNLRPAVRDLTKALRPANPDVEHSAWLSRLRAATASLDGICSGPKPGDVAWTSPCVRELGSLCAALAEAAACSQAQVAAIEQQQQHSDDDAGPVLAQLMALNTVLNSVVQLLEHRAPLAEADVVRALTAAAVSLGVLPCQLRLAEPCKPVLIAMIMASTSQPIVRLLRLSEEEPSPLPPRALAILKAVHLRPATLLRFLEVAVAAAHQHLSSNGTALSATFMELLSRCVVHSDQAEVQEGVRQRPDLQRQIVQLAARGMCPPPYSAGAEEGSSLADPVPAWCYSALLGAHCLAPARWQYEAAASEGASLLNRAAVLAASPEQGSSDTQQGVRILRISCLDLSAVLMRDAVGAEHGGSMLSPVLARRLLASLGTCGPLLADLAAAVAAVAAGAAGAAGAATAAAAADGGSVQHVGLLCWGALRVRWTDALASFARAACCLQHLDSLYQQLTDAGSCAAAAQAAIGLLRLAPLLPQQPGDCQPGSSVTVAATVAALGGDAALLDTYKGGHLSGASQFELIAALSFILPFMAHPLLLWPRSVFPQLGAEHAALAFAMLNATCRYAHSVAAELACGATRAPGKGLFVNPDTAASLALQLMHASATRAVALHLQEDGPRGELVAGLTPELANSRLECMLLCCLPAVSALPTACAHPDQASQLGLSRCKMLIALLAVGTLHPLWAELLGPAAGTTLPLGGGTGTAALLASTAADCLQEAVASWPRLLLGGEGNLYGAVQVLWVSSLLGRAATVSAISRDVVLLRALCQAGKMLMVEFSTWGLTPEDGLQYEQMWALLHAVAHASLGGGAPLLAYFTRQPVFDQQAAGQAFDALLAQLNDSWGSTLKQQPQPDVAAAGQLAVRCARALSLRNCAHPCCANLAASSVGIRGRRCSGCRVVRYCSERCGKADWRGHKVACRLLQAEQQQQGQAEQQGPS